MIGASPVTALVIVAITSVQISIGWAIRDLAIGWVLLLALIVGAHLSFMGFVMIHEASHGLVFRSKSLNRLIAYLANLPMLAPIAERFIMGHVQHHWNMGIYELDLGIPRKWEASWVGNSRWRKLVWLCLHPLIYAGRAIVLLRRRSSPRGWLLLNVLLQAAFVGLVITAASWATLVYFLASWFVSTGLHPVAFRLHQEHEVLEDGQQTNSYYGPMNLLVLNLGYHNEHHDFPGVPWHRLPRLTAIAPQYYQGLRRRTSWVGNYFDFLSSRRRTLWDRTLRVEAMLRRSSLEPRPPGR